MVPWARFRRSKAAVKMHTLLDLHGSIPTFIRITEGKTHDVNILDSRLSALQTGGQRSIERELVYVDNLLLVLFPFVVEARISGIQQGHSYPGLTGPS